MPVQPSFLERFLFNQLNVAPLPLLDLAGAIAYQAMATASQLDLFATIGGGAFTPAELASQLGTNERGIQALLTALESIGYVEKKNDRYANSAMTKKWILGEGIFDLDSAAHYWGAVINQLWPAAAEIIRTGERPFRFYGWIEDNPDLSAAFQKMMVTSALLIGKEIANKLDLPTSNARILDVGGGHGLFSIILCQHYPGLKATILDSPVALKTAQEKVTQYGLDERIELVEGDLWQVPWGQGYDAVLLFNIIHHFDLGANQKLLDLAAGALKQGGQVAVLEQVDGKVFGNASNAFIQLIALQYFLFVDGRVYSAEEIGHLLTESGFEAPRFHSLVKAPGTTLALAKKT